MSCQKYLSLDFPPDNRQHSTQAKWAEQFHAQVQLLGVLESTAGPQQLGPGVLTSCSRHDQHPESARRPCPAPGLRWSTVMASNSTRAALRFLAASLRPYLESDRSPQRFSWPDKALRSCLSSFRKKQYADGFAVL